MKSVLKLIGEALKCQGCAKITEVPDCEVCGDDTLDRIAEVVEEVSNRAYAAGYKQGFDEARGRLP